MSLKGENPTIYMKISKIGESYQGLERKIICLEQASELKIAMPIRQVGFYDFYNHNNRSGPPMWRLYSWLSRCPNSFCNHLVAKLTCISMASVFPAPLL